MTEQEWNEGQDEDVEGHVRRKAKFQAAEDVSDDAEAEGEDDVEAHQLRHRPQSL